MKKTILKQKSASTISLILLLVFTITFVSCDFDFIDEQFIDELPEANSLEDETPPNSFFTFTNGKEIETFTRVVFANQSSNATMFEWDLGNGTTSTERDPVVEYPGEGSFNITLTVNDGLGQTSTYTETIELVMPDPPRITDPVLLNPEFAQLPKSSGSDCTCSGWINKSLGTQAESTAGSAGGDTRNAIKFDSGETDHIYQEFAVSPYETNYTPTYYTDTALIPQDGFGYSSIAQAENAANNLEIQIENNPGTGGFATIEFTFNSRANNSVALFIRGLGGAQPLETGERLDREVANIAKYGYSSGDEEIKIETVTVLAENP